MEDNIFTPTKIRHMNKATGEQFSVEGNGKTMVTENKDGNDKMVQKTISRNG